MTTILHFTLGPVQGFIGEARRLRDFWAGSFLLSLLSGHAMAALVRAAEAKKHAREPVIIFPQVNGDPLFLALTSGTGAPYVGSLPNRFKADVTGIENAGHLCRQAVSDAWSEICESVWDHVVKDAAKTSADDGKAARAIWDRQVDGFWDMAWVTGEQPVDNSDGAWLDQRKNWRSHYAGASDAEGGDHCRMMGQYQEISGFNRIGEKRSQKKFWDAMRKANNDSLDLQADERLCAIALVKRFFPVVARKNGGLGKAMPFVPAGDLFDITSWPSTSYVAALPWLKCASKQLRNAEQSACYEAARQGFERGFMGEATSPNLFGFPENGLFKLDGHLLHPNGVRAYGAERVKSGDMPEDAVRKAVAGVTAELKKTATWIGGGKARHASEFYAVLRMDGDDIGKRLGKNQDLIKKALADFAGRVTQLFTRGNGFQGILVYAGGDDVLAIVPVDTAIQAALAVRKEYDLAFEGAGQSSGAQPFTLSGSIVYAHFKNPLTEVLRASEHELDDVAKKTNGRNSLALAVLKPGGVAAKWVTVFETDNIRIDTLDQLAQGNFGGSGDDTAANGRRGISGGFFHGFRELYEPLFTGPDNRPSDALQPDHILPALITREIRDQFSGQGKLSREEASDLAKRVQLLLRPQKRKQTSEGNAAIYKQPGVAFDGGLVARFLGAEGRFDLNTPPKKPNGAAPGGQE